MAILTLQSSVGAAVFDGPMGMTKEQFPELAKGLQLHRYWLDRTYGEGPTVAFGMLNPSMATHEDNDPTVGRCEGFAKREKAGRMIVVNLFGLVSPEPDDLLRSANPFGDWNEDYIRRAIREADVFILAFGAPKKPIRMKSWITRRLLQNEGRAFWCLGKSKDGWPKHPLYLKGDTKIEEWSFPE